MKLKCHQTWVILRCLSPQKNCYGYKSYKMSWEIIFESNASPEFSNTLLLSGWRAWEKSEIFPCQTGKHWTCILHPATQCSKPSWLSHHTSQKGAWKINLHVFWSGFVWVTLSWHRTNTEVSKTSCFQVFFSFFFFLLWPSVTIYMFQNISLSLLYIGTVQYD